VGDRMRPVVFTRLLRWICEEYGKERTIFGIPESCFFRTKNSTCIRVFDEICETPIGPAAGPHTQLAQNIIAAYLAGGRWIELKTVQRVDDLEIEKPCIDARDEGYNTEWSQELSLEESFDEYLKAWIMLHFLERTFRLRSGRERSFVFNMSVGYDLEGIKSPKMDRFITGLIDASGHHLFERYLHELGRFIGDGHFTETMDLQPGAEGYTGITEDISPNMTRSVTLSTMHGCPPTEIEAISRYLLKEKKLDTFVKLNPTLLGYETARRILDGLGFGSIDLKESTFTDDLQYDDALGLLGRLVAFSKECGRGFGIKLSNTLGAVNREGVLPGEEMYMSGRALFPLTVTLASMLSHEYGGKLPVSYSGGASEQNIVKLFETGIRPITMATQLLKPGGYLRMASAAEKLKKAVSTDTIDVEKLRLLVEDTLTDDLYRKEWRGKKRVSVDKKLPLFDCYIAPCVEACPIGQDVPEYIRLAGNGDYDKALDIIYSRNPLPHITGYICDHQCQYNCTRMDYECSVSIREVKRIAAQRGSMKRGGGNERLDTRVAVIGAGPSGLAASFFLARTGFRVTVFEKRESAGGVVAHVLPGYRLPQSAIESDISFIESLGVDFRFGSSPEFSIDDLKKDGYKYIFIAIGAEIPRKMSLAGDNPNVFEALQFLKVFRNDPSGIGLGRRVAVIGGGNTAMDGARSSLRVPGVEEVAIIYRRTEQEMPADREEFENALREGVKFSPLLLPESFSRTGTLQCRCMTLGEPDKSGRKRPVPTDTTVDIDVDSVISAIGESVDFDLLKSCGLTLDRDKRPAVNTETLETDKKNVYMGGDALRGPSTVVESIADARRAAEAITSREIPGWKGLDRASGPGFDQKTRVSEIAEKRGRILYPLEETDDGSISRTEKDRCLECSTVCNKCVDVCPNRANVVVHVNEENMQVIHLDALCNECGNCATFCPYEGKPYEDKLTLFTLQEDFENSSNKGFIVTGSGEHRCVTIRMNGDRHEFQIDKDRNLKGIDIGTRKDKGSDELNRVLATLETVLKGYSYLIGL
jgi:putative selenate reductase